ncbi:MAG: zf-HC2 domain-containing protein [Acidobacteriota bacterium]
MKNIGCETVLMAAMAAADGHPGKMETAQVEAHLAMCGDCRGELEALGGLAKLLDAQKRRQSHEELWRAIEPRLVDQTERHSADRSLKVWIPVGLILFAYKLFEQIPDRQLALAYKLLPILLVTAGFVYLRQNPFKIKTELKLEGE